MSGRQWLVVAVIGVGAACLSLKARAGDLRITLPKGGLVTPVQRLNRDGVEAIRRHQYEKAKTLFYKAYLYDPDDPFTLNNLGYIAELEGQVERAQRFYALASQQATTALVDQASLPQMQGKPVGAVINNIGNLALEVNRANLQAMRLLSQGRVSEADLLLQENLHRQPGNAFILNNLGVAKEIEGEDQEALKYYTAAASARSAKPVIVTQSDAWRGKTVSAMATENARKLSEFMQGQESAQVRAARLNLRGVSALNRNDTSDARLDFRRAYALDPKNAFSLNNLGYLAEMDGDWETAQSYYEEAQKAYRAEVRIGLATRRSAEGQKLSDVAGENNQATEARMVAEQQMRQRQQGPIQLKRRDHAPVDNRPPSPQPPQPPSPRQPDR